MSVNKDTNKQKSVAYVVCTTPRTGSSVLCEALTSTGQLGKPKEHFLNSWGKFDKRFSDIVVNDTDIIHCNHAVFGTKIMWQTMRELNKYLNSSNLSTSLKTASNEGSNNQYPECLTDLFPDIKYIYLQRENKIRQAVSRSKAIQSGVWAIRSESELKDEKTPNLKYNFHQIFHIYQSIQRDEKAWENYFKKHRISPLRISYEDFFYDPSMVVAKIQTNVLGKSDAKYVVPTLAHQIQSDSTNESWANAFEEELKRKSTSKVTQIWLGSTSIARSLLHNTRVYLTQFIQQLTRV